MYIALTALGGVVTTLWFMGLYRETEDQVKDLTAKVVELQNALRTTQAQAADTWTRLTGLIADLKKALDEKTQQLDKYAAQDPKLAGDRLVNVLDDGVRSSTDSTPVPTAGVSDHTATNGKPSNGK